MAVTTTTLASWGYGAALALGLGGPQYRLRKVYIEYENVGSPGDAVSVPSVDPMNPNDALPYYAGLSALSNRDYLRVDLLAAPQIVILSGYAAYFPPGQGNALNIFTQATAVVGQNGKPFDAAHNSKICGVALVIAPVEDDPTQDILLARSYFTGTDQQLVVDGVQTTVTCQVPFPVT